MRKSIGRIQGFGQRVVTEGLLHFDGAFTVEKPVHIGGHVQVVQKVSSAGLAVSTRTR